MQTLQREMVLQIPKYKCAGDELSGQLYANSVQKAGIAIGQDSSLKRLVRKWNFF